jgi:predicted NAD/FAD-binding protein
MRVAIVGAGISGLACAYALRDTHDLVVFEAADYAGGHANTVTVDTEHGSYDVDTGFIVFNDRNYPGFEGLLDELGVATQPSQMSFGVSDGRDFEYNGSSPNGLFARRRNLLSPAFGRMLVDLVRFNRDARSLMAGDEDPSLRQWLAQRRYSAAFVDRLIVPQASAVWSADPAQMWSFPARFLIEFFDNHGMLGFGGRPRWRTISGGSHRYVAALTHRLGDRLRLSAPVETVSRAPDHVMVTARGGQAERFDAVVLATHSDQALSLLADADERERQLLSAIAYQPNEAVLHTDRSLLPRRRRAWASWNYHLRPAGPDADERPAGPDADERPAGPDAPRGPDAVRAGSATGSGQSAGRSTVTYHMNSLQSLDADREFCVTLNRTEEIDPAKIIRTISYAHPVYTPEAVAAQARHSEISGAGRTHFCGAYWGWGFHEDGVQSGLRVARALGVPSGQLVGA